MDIIFFSFLSCTKEIKSILSNIGLRKKSSSLLFLVFFSGCIDMYLEFLILKAVNYSKHSSKK